MRQDMHELLKVLPCRGGGWAKIKAPRTLDEAPTQEPMRPRVGGWNLKENHDWVTPVKRYLRSQVGRLWNDVFSDICAVNDPRSKTQYDLREYIRYAVHTNVVLVDGEPQDTDGHSIWRDHWVHPDTGILMAAPEYKRRRWSGWRKKFDQVPIDATQKYVRVKGLWYLVTFAPFTREAYAAATAPIPRQVADFNAWYSAVLTDRYRPRIIDVVFGAELRRNYDDACRQLHNEWGSAIYAVEKRQIGSREIKKVTAQWAVLEVARQAS